MSWSDLVTWKGDYGGLDEVWYHIGGTKAVDVTSQKIEDVKTSVVDTVKAPFVAVYNNWDSITTGMKWGILLLVGIGIIWLVSSLGTITQAAGMINDAGNLAKGIKGLL